jgi:hypothetical protein
MNPTTERQIDPSFNDFGPSFTEADLARIFVDDGTNAPRQTLQVAGGPSELPDHVTRPVDPNDDPNGEMPDFDPSLLPIRHGEIGLWSGEEGSDSPLFRKHQAILPEGFGDVAADLPNGGPDAVSEEKKKGMKDFDSPEEKAKREQAQNYQKAVETCTKENNNSIVGTVLNAIIDTWNKRYIDPEHMQSADGFDPHAMIKELLGDGSVLPDDLGIDLKLVGRLLGDEPEGTLVKNTWGVRTASGASEGGGIIQSVMKEAPAGTQGGIEDQSLGVLDKFADFLKRLDGIDTKNGGLEALDAFIKGFGIDGLDAGLRDSQPFIDLDKLFFQTIENAAPTQPHVDDSLLSLLKDKPLDYLYTP